MTPKSPLETVVDFEGDRMHEYAYAVREWDRRRFYLDYNEYMGRIHPDLAMDFNLEQITRHYAFTSSEGFARLCEQKLGLKVPHSFCTHGADEALLHSLLSIKLNWTRSTSPRFVSHFSNTYDHVLTFAQNLGFEVLKTDHADAVNADVVYICSPNNPTGDIVQLHNQSLGSGPAQSDRTQPLYIFDRTYEDYMPQDLKTRDRSFFNEAMTTNAQIVVIKSFAKSIPIAGLRFGWIATNVAMIEKHFRTVYNRKLVTEAAFSVASHSFEHEAFYQVERQSILDSRSVIAAEIQKLVDAEKNLTGLNASVPAGGNFILIRGPVDRLQLLARTLHQVGVSIRLKEAAGLARLTAVSEAFLPELFERLRKLRTSGPYASV